MSNKTIEVKVDTPRDAKSDILEYFCINNSENIVGCGWYRTDFCLKNCKFYRTQVAKEIDATEEYGGSADSSTNRKWRLKNTLKKKNKI